ncbi:hypothetical protein J6590_012911 [Homalodisca vitripennis]|nr:hypothetical protein J6590_012911 [Homalodisca vitripennis]
MGSGPRRCDIMSNSGGGGGSGSGSGATAATYRSGRVLHTSARQSVSFRHGHVNPRVPLSQLRDTVSVNRHHLISAHLIVHLAVDCLSTLYLCNYRGQHSGARYLKSWSERSVTD